MAPSELTWDRGALLRDRFSAGNEDARTLGTLIHLWLSHIRWLSEPPATGRPHAIGGAVTEPQLRTLAQPYAQQLDVDQALGSFQRMLTGDPLKYVLYQDDYLTDLRGRLAGLPESVELEVRTEQEVAGRDGCTVLKGTIDRLVLIRAGGRLVAADIIDFKTDPVEDPKRLAVKQSSYAAQIDAYRRVVSSSLRLPHERVASKIVFVGHGIY